MMKFSIRAVLLPFCAFLFPCAMAYAALDDYFFEVTGLTVQRAEQNVEVTLKIGEGDDGIHNLNATAIALQLHYPSSLLTYDTNTPISGWTFTLTDNSPTTGVVSVTTLSAGSITVSTTATSFLTVRFDVKSTAAFDASESIYIDNGNVNSAATTGANVSNTIKTFGIYQGDVTGNGDVTAHDASYVLQAAAVSRTLATLVSSDFPGIMQGSGPTNWASSGGNAISGRLAGVMNGTPARITNVPNVALTAYSAFEVGDVDGNDTIQSADATEVLKFAVGLVTSFASSEANPAPSILLADAGRCFRATATSERPDAQITVSLDLKDIPDLYNGDLRFDYDRALLHPVSVYFQADGNSPMLAQGTLAGDLGIAFASAYPIQGGTLFAVFETVPGVTGRADARIQATKLVLNRTAITPNFSQSFRIEPYRFRLLANYPNPFNPETWIPFELSEASDVTVRIFDVNGTLVRTLDMGRLPTGLYTSRTKAAYWDGRNAQGERVASGVYVYELTAGKYRALRRMVIAK